MFDNRSLPPPTHSPPPKASAPKVGGDAIEKAAREVIEKKSRQRRQIQIGGNEGVFKFFVGQVMKATKGQANPQAVNDIVRRLLFLACVARPPSEAGAIFGSPLARTWGQEKDLMLKIATKLPNSPSPPTAANNSRLRILQGPPRAALLFFQRRIPRVVNGRSVRVSRREKEV